MERWMWSAEPWVEFMKTVLWPPVREYFMEPMDTLRNNRCVCWSNYLFLQLRYLTNGQCGIDNTTADGEDIFGYRFIGLPALETTQYSEFPTTIYYLQTTQFSGDQCKPCLSKYNRRLIQECNFRYGWTTKPEAIMWMNVFLFRSLLWCPNSYLKAIHWDCKQTGMEREWNPHWET